MAGTLQIIVKTARSSTDLGRFITGANNPRNGASMLAKYFQRVAAGLETCSITVNTGASPVFASGTATLSYADIVNLDTITVAGQVLTCVTGTPTGAQFKKVTSATVTAANLAALINANAVTKLAVYATAASGVVTIKAQEPGEEGNFVTLATSNAVGFVLSAATLANGAGGGDAAPVTYSRGL